MKIPGVVAVGVGLKEVKGEHERIPCFKVTVSAKRDKKELSQSEVIPAEIFGFPTDVTEIIQSSSGSNSEKYRPLIGGSQIEPSGGARFGTLGCFAKRNSDGKIVAVSNWHVMVSDPNNIDNDRIGQPTHNGCCSCCACNEIGKVSDGRFMTDDMDVAIAVLNGQDSGTIPDDRFLKEILQIGSVGGSVAPQVVPTGAGAPLALETVFKYGRSFSVNELNQVVALNFGSNATTHNAVAHSIIRATTTLGITILDNSFHDSVAGKEGVLLNTDAGVGSGTSLSENLAELETELLASREGLRIMELFKSHRTELLDLVRHKREVMAAWNRYQGPAYLAHIARNIRREDKPVPVDIKGITMQSLLLKMAAVLQRNGSSSLSTAVSENYLQLMNILSAGKTHQEWNAYLQQLDKMTYA
jgi:hypothetical protein